MKTTTISAVTLSSAIFLSTALTPAFTQDMKKVEYDCIVEPSKVLKLGSPVVGVLENVMVSRGDKVHRGQDIAQLESSVEKATLEIAISRSTNVAALQANQTKMDYARQQFKRAEALKSRKVITVQRYDQLKTNHVIAVQEYELAKHNNERLKIEQERAEAVLSQRTVKSPINGFVQDISKGAGEYVFQDASILTVVKLDPLFIETFVPVDQYGKISVGMTGTIKLNQPQQMVMQGKVTVVDRVFDAASGTIGVRLELKNEQGLIPAGQRCRVGF